jgi:hypothetical protein
MRKIIPSKLVKNSQYVLLVNGERVPAVYNGIDFGSGKIMNDPEFERRELGLGRMTIGTKVIFTTADGMVVLKKGYNAKREYALCVNGKDFQDVVIYQ